ncbi:hypothetical protein ACFY3M_55625 [Streptomyces mirabilis]|uniref:hypothetical protein n=1 Tax=Streptomyces mirabilis TaxID=68239 RepID=UPI00368C272D
MPKKPPPPTYVDQLLSELVDIETSYASILGNSQVRERQLDLGAVQVFGHPWAWVPSTPEVEASRLELLRRYATGHRGSGFSSLVPRPPYSAAWTTGSGCSRTGWSAKAE